MMDRHPIHADVLCAVLRTDFVSFVRKVFATVNLGDRYIHGKHIEAICFQLDQLRQGRCRRVIVNLPPRSLKSLIVSVAYPAWLLGHNPAARIIVASYSDDLARRLGRDFRRVIEAPWYAALFPAMRIDMRKNTEAEVATTAAGFRYATSVGGTLTGRGGDVIVIDDPIKPMDAVSEAERRRVNEWFDSTVISRLDDPASGAIAQRFSAHRILVEDASSGSALAQALRALVTSPVIAIKPKLDKPARVQRASAVFEAGRVFLPADAPWLPEYRRELLAFPGGRHDDQVDSTSQFLIWAEERPPPIPMIAPIIIPKEPWQDRWETRW